MEPTIARAPTPWLQLSHEPRFTTAIVTTCPEGGTVPWVSTRPGAPRRWSSQVDNTGETLTRQRVSTLRSSPFLRGSERIRARSRQSSDSGLAIVSSNRPAKRDAQPPTPPSPRPPPCSAFTVRNPRQRRSLRDKRTEVTQTNAGRLRPSSNAGRRSCVGQRSPPRLRLESAARRRVQSRSAFLWNRVRCSSPLNRRRRSSRPLPPGPAGADDRHPRAPARLACGLRGRGPRSGRRSDRRRSTSRCSGESMQGEQLAPPLRRGLPQTTTGWARTGIVPDGRVTSTAAPGRTPGFLRDLDLQDEARAALAGCQLSREPRRRPPRPLPAGCAWE